MGFNSGFKGLKGRLERTAHFLITALCHQYVT